MKICIDSAGPQGALLERNRPALRMHRKFRKAFHRCVIWLGLLFPTRFFVLSHRQTAFPISLSQDRNWHCVFSVLTFKQLVELQDPNRVWGKVVHTCNGRQHVGHSHKGISSSRSAWAVQSSMAASRTALGFAMMISCHHS